MLRVRLSEDWLSLGEVRIRNDGTGDEETGHYNVSLYKEGIRKPVRRARVEGFPREEGDWALTIQALKILTEPAENVEESNENNQ